MPANVEIYATGAVTPAAAWAVVSDLTRLPEWTDADAVIEAPEGTPRLGDRFVTRHGEQRLSWRVRTVEPYLLEAETEDGEIAIGVRVARGQHGTRVILAGRVAPRGRLSGLRARLVHAPALRRRFDRWASHALAVSEHT